MRVVVHLPAEGLARRQDVVVDELGAAHTPLREQIPQNSVASSYRRSSRTPSRAASAGSTAHEVMVPQVHALVRRPCPAGDVHHVAYRTHRSNSLHTGAPGSGVKELRKAAAFVRLDMGERDVAELRKWEHGFDLLPDQGEQLLGPVVEEQGHLVDTRYWLNENPPEIASGRGMFTRYSVRSNLVDRGNHGDFIAFILEGVWSWIGFALCDRMQALTITRRTDGARQPVAAGEGGAEIERQRGFPARDRLAVLAAEMPLQHPAINTAS